MLLGCKNGASKTTTFYCLDIPNLNDVINRSAIAQRAVSMHLNVLLD